MFRLYSAPEAAKILGVRSITLVRWYKAGTIAAIVTEGAMKRNRYLFDVAGYLSKNGIDPELYLNKVEGRDAGQKPNTQPGI